MTLFPGRDARRRVKSHLVSALALGCVLVALVPLVGVLYEAVVRGAGALGADFFTKNPPLACNPQVEVCQGGGIANAIQGTLILVALAAAISLPAGVLTGIYVSEYGANRIGRTVRFFMDIMTEIPSIIVGIFVYSLLLEMGNLGWVDRRIVFSTISGTLALATIMVPIVARTAEEALRLVPTTVREAALALGIPKHRVTVRVVLSSAKSGLVTGGLLAVARAAGETAPLIMTAFGNPFGYQGLDQPIEAMPRIIFYYGTSPFPNWQSLAWGATLVLILIMLAISITVRLLSSRRFLGALRRVLRQGLRPYGGPS